MQGGDQRKYGNGIIVSVVTCTEIKQGIAIETGKTSPQYFSACSIIELHEDDFRALGINKNTNVRVTSAAGSVILKAVVTTQSLYPGLAHIPMGPWANMLVPAYTYSTGEPCFCGFDCLVEPAPEEKVEKAVKLLHEKCGLKYVGDPHYD
ncbi:MAG TPA: molybdopterin dinucleotide-binding protein [Methanocorpusculum sp.]|nr:molybdopterin dinucleotide-binding protein [Methanocorpusculum sp.]